MNKGCGPWAAVAAFAVLETNTNFALFAIQFNKPLNRLWSFANVDPRAEGSEKNLKAQPVIDYDFGSVRFVSMVNIARRHFVFGSGGSARPLLGIGRRGCRTFVLRSRSRSQFSEAQGPLHPDSFTQ